MYSSTDLPLAKTEHLHPRLHGKLPAKRVPIDTVYDCGETFVVNRKCSWYTYPASLVLLLFCECTPLWPATHQILRQHEPAVLTDRLPLVEIFDEIYTTAFWADVNSRRGSTRNCWRGREVRSPTFPSLGQSVEPRRVCLAEGSR